MSRSSRSSNYRASHSSSKRDQLRDFTEQVLSHITKLSSYKGFDHIIKVSKAKTVFLSGFDDVELLKQKALIQQKMLVTGKAQEELLQKEQDKEKTKDVTQKEKEKDGVVDAVILPNSNTTSGSEVKEPKAACSKKTKEFTQLKEKDSKEKELGHLKEKIASLAIQIPTKTKIRVFRRDTLDHVKALYDENVFPLVLNMASNHKPGGGWVNGSEAQEESLCRRTTLSSNLALLQKHYPMKNTDIVAIYSPNVIVFSQEVGVFLKQSQYYCAHFISVPFLRLPVLKSRLSDVDAEMTKNKIRFIFEIAIAFEYKALVLSASGCGAFHNPPQHVAELYKEVIEEYPDGTFDTIDFAIISDKNDAQRNYEQFCSVLSSAQPGATKIKQSEGAKAATTSNTSNK